MNNGCGAEFLKSAKWIQSRTGKKNVIVFKKTFSMSNTVGKVFLSICGLGFYEAYINGTRVGNEFFNPVFSDYERRDCLKNQSLNYKGKHVAYYNEYEISSLIKVGENVLKVFVGNGFYRNDDKKTEPFVSYGDKKLIFVVWKEDGLRCAISDETTEVADTGFFSDLFSGDKRDYRQKIDDWTTSVEAKPVCGELKLQPIAGDKIDKTLLPVSVRQIGNGVLYDFGVNHSGGVHCFLRGAEGTKINIFYAEALLKNGMPNMKTSRWNDVDKSGNRVFIDQTSEFILSGETDEVNPLFCWRCYRYVYMTGNGAFKVENAESLFIHTDIERNGLFRSSDERLNRLYDACVLTILDNFHSGILSDCPHREKRAYTGDGQIVSEALFYEFDCEKFLDKWLDDIIAAQRDNGYIPNSAPYISGGGGYAWGNAVAEIPYLLYHMTGKKTYAEKSFEAILRWIEYCYKTILLGEDNDYGAWLLGDWLTPSMTIFDVEFMSLTCLFRAVKIAYEFAKIFCWEEQYKLKKLLVKLKKTVNRLYFDPVSGNYCNGVQGENILPLSFGAVNRKYKEKLIENIKTTYQNNGYRIDTGIVCTKYLFDTLIKNGMSEIACKILLNEDYPSYFDMIDGETTLCEHWSKKWPDYKQNATGEIVKGGGDLSHCHPMFASVLSVLYKYVAGLDLSRLGEKEIEINPLFTDFLLSAEASKQTEYGKTSVRWQVKDGIVELLVEIPDGITAIFGNLIDLKRGVCCKNLDNLSVKRAKRSIKLGGGRWAIKFKK